MAHISPFKAVRPARDKVGLVGSRSYLTYSQNELEARLNYNPYTFLHVIKPELHEGQRKELTRDQRFNLVKDGYSYFKEMGIFKQDAEACYYVYRQTKGTAIFTGLVAGVAVSDYTSGHVKIHEQTITSREKIFEEYLRRTGFNAEPVLLAYPDRASLTQVMDDVAQERPEYEFTTTDMVLHEMWMVSDPTLMDVITKEMAAVNDVYIADGHHRSASSALLAKDKKGEKGPWDNFMSLLLPQSQLKIYDFNRVVKGLNGMSKNQFVAKLSESFDVEKTASIHMPKHRGNFSMYLDNQWYSLDAKPQFIVDSVVGRLDSSVLTDQVLHPLLGISDLKTDKRISFIDGTNGLHPLADAVDSGLNDVAFALYPVEFDQLQEVADTGNIMPPKTTWIEPKLRSGVLIYELDL
ncbi:MAG: hypothetical protein ACI9RU_002129 [Litorivivens sp.]|jgi:uncharacterized protein (DUF1015 family)